MSKSNNADDYGIALGNGTVAGDAANIATPTLDPYNTPYNGSPAIGSLLSNGGAPLVSNHHLEAK